MATDNSYKIYLISNGVRYRFLACYLQHSDGSFYITFERDGSNQEFLTFSSDQAHAPQRVEHTRPKRKKISYHATGCVRYHHTTHTSRYFEPLYHLTQFNAVSCMRIPDVTALDRAAAEVNEGDLDVQVEPVNAPLEFHFVVAPWTAQLNAPHIAVRYKGLFSLLIPYRAPEVAIRKGLDSHFVFFAPTSGIFERQQVSEDAALIVFHQRAQGTDGLIIYSPNGEGVYKVVFSVPMRVPPDFHVTFADPEYTAELVSRTTAVLRFRVKDKHGQTLKKEVPILNISLDAEL